MFDVRAMQALLNVQPFVPFQLHLSNGRAVDVRTREQVVAMRNYAVVALLDPSAADQTYDRHTTVWYLHVAETEMLSAGPPPFSAPPPPPSGGDIPSPSMS